MNSVDRKSNILCFSESLERDLSNGTIKVDIREIKVFDNLAIYTMDYNYNNSPWSEAEK